MSLIQNAVDSIANGLSDFGSKDRKRIISAVRNIHAGILLLFKEKLQRLSPKGSNDALIKERIVPVIGPKGRVFFVGKGRKTVDVRGIQERFTSLGISVDWKRFERVNTIRNDIEHYYTAIHPDAIRKMISDTFILIRDFIKNELEEDPLEILGQQNWKKLLEVSEVFDVEFKESRDVIDSIDWKSDALTEAMQEVQCNECGSPLLLPVARAGGIKPALRCKSCGEEREFEDYGEAAIKGMYEGVNFRSIKDGGEELTTTCPHCFRDAYIVDEERCAICGESCEHVCSRCGNRIPVSELSDGDICGWCQHMWEKMMAE